MNCRTAALYVVDDVSRRGEILASYNWTSDAARRAVLTCRLAAVTRENAIYFDAFAPACDGILVLPLVGEDDMPVGAWCVTDPLEVGQLTAEMLEIARAISPHILRTLMTASQAERERLHAAIYQNAFDALASGTLIIDARGTIVFRNAVAAAELAEGSLFRERDGRLVGLTPEASRTAARISTVRTTDYSRNGDVEIAGPDSHVLQVSWAPLAEAAARLVVLQRLDLGLDTAAQRFKLTTAEALVLAQLLEGLTLSEAADNLGIARSTVKTHLDAIFRKSDTRRRAELVRRTLGLRPSLRC
jgi:DNA-binding CsgD family transcriptional regulator